MRWFGAVQNTHIPKLSKESASGLNRFGVVQIRVYQNIFRNILTHYIGSELCKKHIYQNSTSAVKKSMKGSELCKYTYTKTESLYYLPKNLVRSYTIMHIPKHCYLQLYHQIWFGAVQKTHIPKPFWHQFHMLLRFGAVQHAYTKT